MLGLRDFLLAFVLHLLIVVLILEFNAIHVKPEMQPLRTIKVSMVSLKDLQEMLPQEQVKPVEVPAKPEVSIPPELEVVTPAKPEVSIPPEPEVVTPAEPEVVIPPKPKMVKKVMKKVVKVAEDPNYDPFAPLASKHNKPKAKPKSTAVKAKAEPIVAAAPELSNREMDRYIVAMQRAVEAKWKVPVEFIEQVKDAYVELQLLPTGMVASARILDSSGSAILDETLLQAIYAAAPFAIPIKHYELFKVNRIRFFPLH